MVEYGEYKRGYQDRQSANILIEEDYKRVKRENHELRELNYALEKRNAYLSETLGQIYLMIKERMRLN